VRQVEGWRRRPAWKARERELANLVLAEQRKWAEQQERQRQEKDVLHGRILAEMLAEHDAWMTD
jgi:hypothetical protein